MSAGRTEALERFLASAGWAEAQHCTLAEDASFRRYERVSKGSERAVLMDAPPDREDVRPFLLIARKLQECGYSAPIILAEDVECGFLLLEDLGDETFSRLLDGGTRPEELYTLAVDLLIDLHRRPAHDVIPSGLLPYDNALFEKEAALLTEWYLPSVLPKSSNENAFALYREIWRALLPRARGVPETLVLRDFHVDNLIRVGMRDGIAACGLLDFQDAVKGPVTYDLISLLEDARRDVPDSVTKAIRTRYLKAFPDLDETLFDCSCAILGAQRHCKVLGIFTRLRDRDGKVSYLEHVPRVWRLLERAVMHPALGELKAWLDEYVPTDHRVVPSNRTTL